MYATYAATAVETAARQTTHFEDAARAQLIQRLIDQAKVFAQDESLPNRDEVLQALEKEVKQLITNESLSSSVKKATSEAAVAITNKIHSGSQDIDFETIFKEHMGKLEPNETPEFFEQHEAYKKFVRGIGRKGPQESEDEDLELIDTGDDQQKIICSLSGQVFKDPVKNKQCIHVFERANFMAWARKTHYNCPPNHVPCPMAGCNKHINKNTVETCIETIGLIQAREGFTQNTYNEYED